MNCRRNPALLAFTAALLMCDAAFAAPGQNIYRWEPPVYDSAAMAVIMKQLDDGTGAFGKNSGGGNSGTTLVCGGGGSSGTSASATANSSCIILNNSTGDITTGQNSDGDQSATANSKTSTSSSMSDALSVLVPGGQ